MSHDLARQRILVTGGTGFLGQALVKQLRAAGATVLAAGQVDGDLTQAGAAHDLITRYHPTVVAHLAAVVGGIGANRARPADFLTANTLMGLHVLQACVAEGVSKVLMLGSICAYPKHTPVPFREDDLWNGYPEETNAPYGTAKRLLLVAAQAYRQQHGLNAVTVFPTNLYGPGDHVDARDSHVIPALISKFDDAVRTGAVEVVLWGDGSPTRGFLYVADCAAALVRTLEVYDQPAPLNLGSGEEVTIRDLAALVAAAVGFTGRVRWDTSYPNGQPRRLVDHSRAHYALAWEPQVTLAAGLPATVAAYRADRGVAP
jgi:GDP-L-fucose synthase